MNSLLLTLSLAFLVIAPISAKQPDYMKSILSPEQMGKGEDSLNDAKQQIKLICSQMTKSDKAYNNFEKEIDKSISCAEHLGNVTMLELEADITKLQSDQSDIGDIKKIVRKICSKKEKFYGCIDPAFDALEPCLNEEMLRMKVLGVKVFKRLISETCSDDGGKAIDFATGNGVTCFNEQFQQQMLECVGPLAKYAGKEKFVLPSTAEQCHDLNDFQKCIAISLKKCHTQTAVNLVDPLLSASIEEVCSSATSMGTQNTSLMLLGTMLMAYLLSKF